MKAKRKITNLLVTGGSGFIGSSFIRYLLTQVPDFKGILVNYDLLTYAGNPENLKEIDQNVRYVFQQGDIRDQALFEALLVKYEIDAVIHFAAESHVDRSILGPQSFIETNIMGTFHLLEVIRRHPHIHFHHVSTDEVYGCLGESGYFTENSPYHPNSPYSASKASSDHLVRAYGHTYNLSTCISNCSNNYGPYQFPEKFIPLIILNCLKQKPLPIYGEGKNVRDWLYVEDHVQALWLLLEKGKKGETYNIGGEQEKKNVELVQEIISSVSLIEEIEEKKLQSLITFVKDRPGHDFRYAIDCTKIKEELGWHPSPSFKKNLKETVQWYRDHLDWVDNVVSGHYRHWLELNYHNR